MQQNLAENESFSSMIKRLGGRDLHEHSDSKRVCCLLWTKIPFSVYELLLIQREDLEQLLIVYCRARPYIRFTNKECSYYSQIITHDILRLHSSLLI